MPKIVVEGPDGRKFAFPDTMPRAEINAFMKQKYGTKAPNESVQDYLARYGREQAATEARARDIDREATAAGRAEGERAAERMGVTNPLMMAVAAPAIGLAQQSAARDVYNREGTVLADEAAGLSAINAAGFFVPGMVNREFGARVEEGRRQQPLAAFAGDVAGGFGPGEIIGAGVSKAVQAIGPGMAALGRMLSRGPGPDTSNAIVGGTLGGLAPAETAEERARNVAVGAGLGYVARPGSKLAADLTAPSAPSGMPDAMPAGGYFGRQSMRPPGSGPSAREIETQQQWSTATPIVSQARTTAQSAQQAAEAALQSKAPADIARAKDQKKALVGQLQEAQASRAGMDTPEDARLAETLASLAENTSDPVLLSTQISAAKTSLDRLLTDIGSPVQGNLIPVKTQILTRTQAPRSAAEGPQDRASVTRYAEGGDDVKPQGFGASTPKTPQQAARFETPGSPEYEAAVAKGLDMSQAGRMARAKDMGFDTETVLYHGTLDKFQAFDTSRSGSGAVHLTPDEAFARQYAATKSQDAQIDKTPLVGAYHIRGKLFDPNNPDHLSALEAALPESLTWTTNYGWGAWGRGTQDTAQSVLKKVQGIDKPHSPLTKEIYDAAVPGQPLKEYLDGQKVIVTEKGDGWIEVLSQSDFARNRDIQELSALKEKRASSEQLTDYERQRYLSLMDMRGRREIRSPKRVELDPAEQGGFDTWAILESEELRPYLKDAGFEGALAKEGKSQTVVLFDPSNIRSVNAAFDPDKAGSSTLLAAAPFAAVGGAGLTSERELGSKMKRDKKD